MKKRTKMTALLFMLGAMLTLNVMAGQKPKLESCYSGPKGSQWISSFGNTCIDGDLTCNPNSCKN